MQWSTRYSYLEVCTRSDFLWDVDILYFAKYHLTDTVSVLSQMHCLSVVQPVLFWYHLVCIDLPSNECRPRDAVRSLRKRIKHKNPKVTLLALTVSALISRYGVRDVCAGWCFCCSCQNQGKTSRCVYQQTMTSWLSLCVCTCRNCMCGCMQTFSAERRPCEALAFRDAYWCCYGRMRNCIWISSHCK